MILSLLIYIIIGALVGTLAGLLGIGGGLVIIPTLIFIFSSDPTIPANALMHFAVGTSLAASISTTLFSLRAHHYHGNVTWPLFLELLPGIGIGTIGGVVIASFLDTHVLKTVFGYCLLLIAMEMFFKITQGRQELPGMLGQSLVALVIGVFSGLLGISGGALTIPYLIHFNVPIRQAIGASTACGVVITLIGACSFMIAGQHVLNPPAWSTGYVYWPTALGIALTSPWFVKLGILLSNRLPVIVLKRTFAGFLFLIGLKMLI